MSHQVDDTAQDAERWWRAYQLAENDQTEELRERAEGGDEHARWHLAGWLLDRVKTEEALEVIRPLADDGHEAAERLLARCLADGEHIDELRRRAGAGSYPALYELAEWLSGHEDLTELRALLVEHRELLAGWLARVAYPMRVVRLAAELGDDAARRRLQWWLLRLRERADAGDEYAREFLAENPEWRRFQPDWA